MQCDMFSLLAQRPSIHATHNKPYLLALNRVNGLGPRRMAKLLTRWPNLADLFVLTTGELVQAGLSDALAQAIKSVDLACAEEDWRWALQDGRHLLTWEDSDYPALLKEIPDPPPVLYAMGDLVSFRQTGIAIVGTRKPSISGSETAWRFAFELASQNITIVSGLALGIDAQAHSGCLAAKGKTIAVMGTGIDCIYPRRHEKLAERIVENGLLLSEFPLKSPPIAGHFPYRNRIICGLSLSTLVIEAAIRSGSLITARLALEQNRDVLAVPGSIYNQQTSGCHYLLQQGARLVTSSADILSELPAHATHNVDSVQQTTLARSDENLVQCIGFEVTTVDQIIERSGLSVETVVCHLAELELRGIVRAVPGGYMRCIV